MKATAGERSASYLESGDMRKLTARQVCEMARSLEGVTEKDHFGSDAFCANGRIFATVWHDKNECNLMLNLEQQRNFLAIDGEGFSQIDNAWGRKGATNVQLDFVDREQFLDALKAAWVNSASKRAARRKVNPKKSFSSLERKNRP